MCRSVTIVLAVLWCCTAVIFFLRTSATDTLAVYEAARSWVVARPDAPDADQLARMRIAFERGHNASALLLPLINLMAFPLLAASLCQCAIWLQARGYAVDRSARRVVYIKPDE